jgi:uncharacterized protein (TIGR02147 family)
MNPSFSLRAFAKRLEVSPAQLSQILSSKRNLTLKQAKKIAAQLGISAGEFSALVGTTTPITRPDTRELTEDVFLLISEWYSLAILALSEIPGAKSDHHWIAEHLGVDPFLCQEAVTRLLRLELIQIKDGLMVRNCKDITTPANIPSSVRRRYHNQVLELAQAKLEELSLEEREFTSLIVPADASLLSPIKEILREARDKINALTSQNLGKGIGEGSRVFIVNTQVFPVTSTVSKTKTKPKEKK